MNAPSLKFPTDLNVIDRFTATSDIAVRSQVTAIWLEILVTAYRDLMKKMQLVAGYSPEAIKSAVSQCQADFAAYPEYDYILAHGSSSQQAHAKLLFDSLAVDPQPARHVEPVVLVWPSVAELRGRVRAALI